MTTAALDYFEPAATASAVAEQPFMTDRVDDVTDPEPAWPLGSYWASPGALS